MARLGIWLLGSLLLDALLLGDHEVDAKCLCQGFLLPEAVSDHVDGELADQTGFLGDVVFAEVSHALVLLKRVAVHFLAALALHKIPITGASGHPALAFKASLVLLNSELLHRRCFMQIEQLTAFHR